MDNFHTYVTIFVGILSILGVINGFLLSMILSRISTMSEKLDLKKDKEDCREAEGKCDRNFSDLWDVVNRHSHSTLPLESRVTRG